MAKEEKKQILKIRNLKKAYELATPLEDVSCDIYEGDVISIIGPSGCGKSTFINCINRLVEPTSGQIFFDGEEITAKSDLPAMRMRMGMVFQSFHLFAHLTVLENVMIAPMTLRKMPREEAFHKAMDLLKMVGLESKADRYPAELSGGQQQRIAICRSLAMDPEILLFDEPTSALDPTMVGEVEMVIKRLAQSGLTMMIVTHEMKFARSVANRTFYMDEGGIYEDGTPEEVFGNPRRPKTRWFINRMKLFSEEIRREDFDLYGIQSRFLAFARGQMMSSRLQSRVQLVFEEFVYHMLFERLEEGKVMTYRVAYDDEKDMVDMTILMPGKELAENTIEEVDPISLKIVMGVIVPNSYGRDYVDGENRIFLQIGGFES